MRSATGTRVVSVYEYKVYALMNHYFHYATWSEYVRCTSMIEFEIIIKSCTVHASL